MKIGIFGGSFDPVHNDHVRICLKFKEELNLDSVIVLPANISPFKDSYRVTGEHRKKMLELAFENYNFVSISDYELNAGGKSYTYLTLEHFKNLYPNAKLYFLMGCDSLAGFYGWRNTESILQNATIAVAGRNGFNIESEVEKFKRVTGKELVSFSYDGNISSTYLCEQLKLGLFNEEFTCAKVLSYIKENSLYKGDNLYEFAKSKLKPSRLFHTAGVIATAVSYAKKLGENVNNARIAALLHDIAKYESPLLYPECEISENVPEGVKHQYLGAHIANKVLNINSEDILNAIRYHTTGRPGMSTLEKIIFVADFLEPSRDYEEVNDLRNLVNENFEVGFKRCVKRLVAYLERTGGNIYYLTYDTDRYYNG